MTLAELNVVIGAEIDDFEKQIKTLEKGIGRLGDKLKDSGEAMTKFVTLPLSLLAGASLKAAGDMQALEKGFNAVYKGAGSAAEELAKVKEVAKLPGLGLKEAIQGSINLQAAGFSADQARSALTGFGNALATVGKGKADLDGVTAALSQMAAKGKISAEEINQISERVPQIRKVMQEAFGTADTEALSKMGIGVEEFVSKVTGELNKLPRVSGGINNAFENLADSGTSALARLGDSLNKAFDVEGKLNGLADGLNSLIDGFESLSPTSQKIIFVFGGIAAAVGPLLLAIGGIVSMVPVISAGFGAISTAALALKAGFLSSIPAVVSFVASMAPIIVTAVGAVAAIGSIIVAIKSLRDAQLASAKNNKGFGENFKTALKGNIDGLKDSLGGLFTSAKDSATGLLGFNKATEEITEKTTRAVPILEKLNTQLKEQQQIRDNATSANVIRQANIEIAAIQKQIDYYNNLGTSKKKAAKIVLPIVPEIGGPKIAEEIKKIKPGSLDEFSLDSLLGAPQLGALEPGMGLNLLPGLEEFPAQLEKSKNAWQIFQEDIISGSQSIQEVLASGLSGAFDVLGTAIAGVASGDVNFFSNMEKAVKDFAKTFGQFLIKWGIGALVTANPLGAAAILAGGALIAFSGSGGGGGGAATGSARGGSYSAPTNRASSSGYSHSAPDNLIAETRLSGSDIVIAIQRAEAQNGRRG